MEEYISVGKPVKGKKNKIPHNPRVGLGLTNEQILEAWTKRNAPKEIVKPKEEIVKPDVVEIKPNETESVEKQKVLQKHKRMISG